jgi:aryl-alcohol dehydrogenase-like predicted oxidoreductase
VSATTLRRACAVHPIACVQIEYSPFFLEIERNGLLQACRELGVAVVAYSPLGRGMLTGKYKSAKDFDEGDFRLYAPQYSDENFPKNLKLVDEIAALAKVKKCTTGQLTLAWLSAQGEDMFLIPGSVLPTFNCSKLMLDRTKKTKYLEENVASSFVELSVDDLKAIREAIDRLGVYGNRYPDG